MERAHLMRDRLRVEELANLHARLLARKTLSAHHAKTFHNLRLARERVNRNACKEAEG